MNLEFHPGFRADFAEATRYYRDRAGIELAETFIEEVMQTIREIEKGPARFSIAYGEVRRARLTRFKSYSIRYSFDPGSETLFIGSLMHGARHPDTDKDRF